jgi:TRAP-type C4-dicarboxylate transport system permease small subunit
VSTRAKSEAHRGSSDSLLPNAEGRTGPADSLPLDTVQPPRRFAPEEWACAGVMALLCLITLANVLVRYLTNISFAFTEEISVWLIVVMTLVGASAAFVRRQHIAITLLPDRLGGRSARVLEAIAITASLVMFALLVVLGTRMAWDDLRYEVTTPGLGLPQWLYTLWLPLLSLVIVLRLLAVAWRQARPGSQSASGR